MSRHSRKSEPADPSLDREIHQQRRDTLIAPTNVDPDRLPKPFLKCGCDDCSDSVSPLASDKQRTYAADKCPNPTPLTVQEAAEVYLRYQQSAWNSSNRTSKLQKGIATYGSLLGTDRELRLQYDDLTTVLLSRRLSPIADGEWITPFEIDERLHGDDTNTSVTRSLRHHLRKFEYEYVGVTATTDSAATPHEHIYIWIDDPENTISTSDFKHPIDLHIEKTGAASKDHREGEAITVRHDPPLVNTEPNKIDHIQETCLTADGGSLPRNTRGAQYLANQLPHLSLADRIDPNGTVEIEQIDGGAIAWATPHKWLRSSNGIMSDCRDNA